MSELMHQQTLEHCAQRVEIGTRTTIQGIMQAGQALSEARSIFGENDKGFGQWRESRLPWLNHETARNWLKVWEKFGATNLLANNLGVELSATVLYQLAAPSTPDEVVEKATEKAESGEKVTVEDVKRWKAEADRANRKIETLEEKLDEITSESINRFKEAESLRSQLREQPVKIIEKEVLPADYEATKAGLEQARQASSELQQKIKDLKKRQAQEVENGVQAAIKFHEKELAAMENRRAQAERRYQEIEAHIKKLGVKAKTHEFHDTILSQWEHELIELSCQIAEFEYIPETRDKWLRLAKNFADASQAISAVIQINEKEDENGK